MSFNEEISLVGYEYECPTILVMGERKGQKCGNPKWLASSTCRRHAKMKERKEKALKDKLMG